MRVDFCYLLEEKHESRRRFELSLKVEINTSQEVFEGLQTLTLEYVAAVAMYEPRAWRKL